MGFDVGDWTVRVLDEGLPLLPERLEPSQTVPMALWWGGRHGAVLFVRLWRRWQVPSANSVARFISCGSKTLSTRLC
jgi:hypothetical protein